LYDLDADALFDTMVRIKGRAHRDGVQVRFTPDLSRDQLRDHFAGASLVGKVSCIQPWLRSRIDPWGQVYPCWLDVRMGDVRSTDFASLWNGEGYRSFRRVIRSCGTLPKCATCPALSEARDRAPLLQGTRRKRWRSRGRSVRAAIARLAASITAG
jgi:radical SAM protein with 4Fe4S-binding SPASM domain